MLEVLGVSPPSLSHCRRHSAARVGPGQQKTILSCRFEIGLIGGFQHNPDLIYNVGDLSVVWPAGPPCSLPGECQRTSVLHRLGYVRRLSSPVLQQHCRALPSCLQTTLPATRHTRRSQVVPHHGHHHEHHGADHHLWWAVVRLKHQEDLSDPEQHWRLADLLSPPTRAPLSLQLGLSVR